MARTAWQERRLQERLRQQQLLARSNRQRLLVSHERHCLGLQQLLQLHQER
jgi:hypothetical protein